jgi:uncharacterized membrane protein YjfL (UPF0719 family)
MLTDTIHNLGWAVVFALVGGLIGIALILISAVFLPRFIDRMTPNLDEEKELIRGNRAVADYFGRVVAAAILGISLIVAAAILGGLIAALH